LPACPPCTGTIHQKYFYPLTLPLKKSARYGFHKRRQWYFQQRITMPAETHAPRSSQPRTCAIIHLNTQKSGDYASRLTPLHRSDNPSPNLWTSLFQNQFAHPNAPKPIHPDKEHFSAPDNQAGSKPPNLFAHRPFQER
jgi:hypothetical protein